MTSQRTIEYIKTRVSNTDFTNSGEITVSCTITLDDGTVITGSIVRDISSFDSDEAQAAAYNNTVGFLYPGADLILAKTI